MTDKHPNIRPTPLVDSVLSHPCGAYKWQKKYDPAINEYIPDLYQGGKTDAQVAVAIGIHKGTLYDWIKQYPAFADAVRYGKSIAESYTTQVGMDAVDKERKINDKVWHTLMRNCYDYDRPKPNEEEQAEKDRQARIDEDVNRRLNAETE